MGGAITEAWAVNASGTVAGWGKTPTGVDHAIVAIPSGHTYDLGTLPGDVTSFAQGINDAGAAVGDAEAADGSYRAFVWTSASGMAELPGLGGVAVAFGVDDAGQAWGQGSSSSGQPVQPVLWTCVGGAAPTARTDRRSQADHRSQNGPGRSTRVDARRRSLPPVGSIDPVDAARSDGWSSGRVLRPPRLGVPS